MRRPEHVGRAGLPPVLLVGPCASPEASGIKGHSERELIPILSLERSKSVYSACLMAPENFEKKARGSDFESAFALEGIDRDFFRSVSLWRPAMAKGVFGGQVCGLSLLAATRTVDPALKLHSLHSIYLFPMALEYRQSYFILSGSADVPIVFHVERVRDGRSYATRTVQAIQNGRAIFTVTCSFHRPELDQPSHLASFAQAPDFDQLPSPEELPSEAEKIQRYMDQYREQGGDLDSDLYKRWHYLRMDIEGDPIELRNVLSAPSTTEASPPIDQARQIHWLRSKFLLSTDPADAQADAMRKVILAYASDHRLIGTAAIALGMMTPMSSRRDRSGKEDRPKLGMMVSLDHTIWFHDGHFDPNQWLLYVAESPKTGFGRGFVLGRIYTRDGRLVASIAQEGMVRAAKAKL